MFSLLLALTVLPIDKEAPELPPPPQIDLAGWYSFESEDDGPNGVVVLRPGKSEGVYSIRWHMDGGLVAGVAKREGGYLYVAWSNGDHFALHRYRVEIEKDQRKLRGEWGTKETWTWLRALK